MAVPLFPEFSGKMNAARFFEITRLSVQAGSNKKSKLVKKRLYPRPESTFSPVRDYEFDFSSISYFNRKRETGTIFADAGSNSCQPKLYSSRESFLLREVEVKATASRTWKNGAAASGIGLQLLASQNGFITYR